jgi:hypothetical protein
VDLCRVRGSPKINIMFSIYIPILSCTTVVVIHEENVIKVANNCLISSIQKHSPGPETTLIWLSSSSQELIILLNIKKNNQ